MKIGIMAESLGLPFPEAIKKAAELGVGGIQMYETNPDELTDAIIKEKRDIVASNGLVFSAICGDFNPRFGDEEYSEADVERSLRIIDAAKKLGCDIVTTHVGLIPAEECKRKEVLRKACRTLAEYADSIGSSFALETGTEVATTLADFLDSLGATGVKVNFDPANLVMCVGDRPETAVKTLGKYIVHTHAKDGIMLGENSWEELPLGEGHVNFDLYLPALASTGYDGFLTIERETGDDPIADIAMAVGFLRERLDRFGL